MRDWVAIVLLWIGVGLELLAVLGICVMRNAFDRLHCVSLAGYGALLIAVSILVRESFSLIGDKALLTGALVVLLSPVLLHTTMRSLRIRAYGDWRRRDEEEHRT
jgi:multisubunit Na+/H+ antiporter MnhG subunit